MMGLLAMLGLGKELAEPIKNLADPINAVGNLYTTDKARIEAETKLEDVEIKPVLAQEQTNSILASSSRFFLSAWQPSLGWICGFLIFIYYFPQIIIATWVWGAHCFATGIVAPFPIKADDILNLVYLLFGFGVHSLVKSK